MTNRLADETSPYLLQHADNPVDWYPWGPEALDRAAGEDKPLLISIGYAACHWCHVMAHESFEDPEVAQVMNEHFVNVKVDREERPDVDAIYMGAVQALTGHGGWPMTIFATPDGTPFLGGTYFPPTDRQGMPSFRTVLERVDELWRTRRDDLFEQGSKLLDAIKRSAPAPSKEPLGSNLLVGAATQIMRAHDAGNGGFGEAPKFPQAPVLELLLRIDARTTTARRAAPSKRDRETTARRAAPSKRDQSGRPKEALELTLRKMALGGIYDQLGGGFHRYTVDAEWVVPHFEKMLYDNAQLARVYTHAWQAYGDPLYRRIATETLGYLLRDMRDDAGGFHSSEDADSEGEEGKFYVFSYEEFMAIAPEAADHYVVSEAGNFEGANILVASGAEPPAEARAKLLEARERRVRPGRDDKVLASWNGLVIAALAEAGAAFDRSDLVEAAAATADFILSSMTADGRLLHTFRDGRAKIPAFLEDHAYLADGLLSLWEATFDPRWLEAAERLAREALERFGAENGALYTASEEHDGLVVRQTEVVESATPAPAAVLAIVLQRLAHLFDDAELRSRAAGALRIARLAMDRAPQATATWLAALDFYVATPKEVAFTGPIAGEAGKRLRSVVDSRYLPNRVMAADADGLSSRVALLADKPTTDEATAYVCERYVCQAPTSDPDELARQLAPRPGGPHA